MEIALFNLMSLNHPGERADEVVRRTVRLVQRAEAAGFDGAWFAEHHFSSFSVCPSPLLMAAHCAAATRRIRLGPAVLVLPLYEPMRLAEEITLFELMSGGRAMLGLGTGHQPHEFRSLRVPIAERHAIALEVWDILEQALGEGRVHYDGAHFRIPPTELTIRLERRPPIFVAGHEPNFLGRAAQRGAVPFISQGYRDVAAARAMRDGIARIWAEAGGATDPLPLAVQRYVFPTRDKAEARAAAEGLRALARKILSLRLEAPPRAGVHLREVPFPGEPSLDDLLATAPIGDPQRVADLLGADVAALSPAHMSFYMGFTGLGGAAEERALSLFAEEVLPQLR